MQQDKNVVKFVKSLLIGFYPKIKKLLDEIANIKYSNFILSYSNTYHFTILHYLNRFCNEFPEDAANYLIRILMLNDFLINSIMTSTILEILEKLLIDNIIDPMQRNKLIEILNKISDTKYQKAEEIRGKLKKFFYYLDKYDLQQFHYFIKLIQAIFGYVLFYNS